jgi:hypothetical protein
MSFIQYAISILDRRINQCVFLDKKTTLDLLQRVDFSGHVCDRCIRN